MIVQQYFNDINVISIICINTSQVNPGLLSGYYMTFKLQLGKLSNSCDINCISICSKIPPQSFLMVSPTRSSSTKEGCHGILPRSQQLRSLKHFKTNGLRVQRCFSLVSFRCCHLFFIARTCRLTNGTVDNLHRRHVCQHEKCLSENFSRQTDN